MAPKSRDRRELPFFDHLDELRARIIRTVIYISVGATAGWHFRRPILALLCYPAEEGARQVGIEELPFRIFEPAAGFVIAIQVALLTGIILATPLLFWEIWRFIEPALEDNERRYAIVVIPFATLLFLGGVAFCYFVSPRAFAFLISIDISLHADVERTLKPYLWFMMRLLLAFGLAFELPLVLMFLGFIGVVTHRQLLAWWRHAIVIIFVFAAVVTPTPDPVNMTILAGPVILLYMISILLVAIVQRKTEPEQDEDHPDDEDLGVYGNAGEGDVEDDDEDLGVYGNAGEGNVHEDDDEDLGAYGNADGENERPEPPEC